MLDLLKAVVAGAEGYAEIRYHRRLQTVIEARNGALKQVERRTLAGAGVRCLVDGSWGFVSTTDVSESGLSKALAEASQAARAGARLRRERATLAPARLARGEFIYQDDAGEPDIATKIETVLAAEKRMRDASPLVVGSIVVYTQYADEKFIVTSDGAQAHIRDNKPSFHVMATALRDGKREAAGEGWGVTGTWQDLMKKKELNRAVDQVVELALKKLDAGYAKGGQYTVILDPELVGVLSHEAIGHTVEADFVQSGSVVKDKIGEMVASDLVTLVDDGTVAGAAGMVLVDDEGVQGERTVIIDKGILRNYLHSRESAAAFGTEPRGNARAFTYRDEPIIRMTNTFILPGEADLDDMIAGVEEGFFLKGMGQGGQADATAEFMFGVAEAYKIERGKVGELVKGMTISGQAFEVLKSVDAISKDFELDLGASHCGKWQPAKVDAGGPYLRCRVTIGGRQE
ncbi:MAG: TldD/PmbA family protein [Bacillota bacterium]